MNFSPGAEQEPGISVTTFTPEIESEVDAFYKRMYDQDISVENVVALLQRAKESDNVHDHDFLACFLHGLFDEYKFFATYPQQELTLTAFLFGSLIQNHLIDYIPLGIAVRYVLDALRNPPDSNWFRFGVQALSRFQPRLHEWPSLAQAILDIPHLADAHPDIANVARAALSAPEGAHENGILDDGQLGDEEAELEDENKAFTALKPDKVARRRAAPEQPPEAVSDRILFTINNLAPTNLESKVKDLDGKMEETHFRWFANYLVDQRVSIEPNNQQLYMQFLDALELKALFKEVQQETLIRAEELLNSEQTVQSSNQRTLLKNLGAWLGALTLAKNLPVKHKNVSFKDLLIEGYDSNRLIVAIPFVCKVLEQCAKSKIFKPPNPWLMAILRLLVELYQFAELKLNLKFEIEVLCKNLNIDLKEIQPTTTLRDRPPKEIAPAENGTTASQDLEKKLANGFPSTGQNGEASSQGQPGKLPAPASGLSLLGAATSSGAAGYSLALADAITAALATIPQYLNFSAQVAAFSSNATLKRLVQLGIDRAVREVRGRSSFFCNPLSIFLRSSLRWSRDPLQSLESRLESLQSRTSQWKAAKTACDKQLT
jgi:CCR4-NOT transcription complex subunit 1